MASVSNAAIHELAVQSGVAVDCDPEIELLPHQLSSAVAHRPRPLSIIEEIENSLGQKSRGARGNQEPIPAVAHNVTAAGHLRRHDR
jgi:hypothetical protein